jgi:hypothetical protein
MILMLALFVLMATFVLETGGGTQGAEAYISIHDLSTSPETHAGESVTTTGVLKLLQGEATERYLITAEGQGISLLEVPPETLRPLVDVPVTVTGVFGFDAANGTFIEVDTVKATR